MLRYISICNWDEKFNLSFVALIRFGRQNFKGTLSFQTTFAYVFGRLILIIVVWLFILWWIREKIGTNCKFHVIVGTKKCRVSLFLELKIWRQSTFGTRIFGVVPLLEWNLKEWVTFLEPKNPELIEFLWIYLIINMLWVNHQIDMIDFGFLSSRNGLSPSNLVPKVE